MALSNLTMVVTEKSMSINDIEKELLFATDGNADKREEVLLETVQELASRLIAVKRSIEF